MPVTEKEGSAWYSARRATEVSSSDEGSLPRAEIVVCCLLDLVLGILKMWQVEMTREKDSGLCTIAVLLAQGETEAMHAHYSSPKLLPAMRSGPLSIRVNRI